MDTFESHSVNTGPLGQARASADGRPERVIAGITLAIASFAALGADLTLPDGTVIPTGKRVVPFGAVLVENGSREYIPWDGAAALVNSKVIIIDETITNDDPRFLTAPGACNGGAFFEGRLKYSNGGVWTVLSGAMLTALVAAMPRLVRKRMS
mgnify:CR=1 FL=1